MKELFKEKSFLAAFTVFFILLVWMSYLKGSLPFFDAKLFYLKSQIRPILDSLGEEGRAKYRLFNELDFLFVAVYTFLFYETYRIFFKESALKLFIIPVFVALVDYVENGSVYYLLHYYPQNNSTIETILFLATPIKWFFAISALLILVNGYLVNWYLKQDEK